MLAHLVSHLFHPCEVNKGCDAGVRTREGNRTCRLIPIHHKREPMSPSCTFAHFCGRQRIPVQSAKSNYEKRQANAELQCDKSNVAGMG